MSKLLSAFARKYVMDISLWKALKLLTAAAIFIVAGLILFRVFPMFSLAKSQSRQAINTKLNTSTVENDLDSYSGYSTEDIKDQKREEETPTLTAAQVYFDLMTLSDEYAVYLNGAVYTGAQMHEFRNNENSTMRASINAFFGATNSSTKFVKKMDGMTVRYQKVF